MSWKRGRNRKKVHPSGTLHKDSKGRPIGTKVDSSDLETQGAGTWVIVRKRLKMKHLKILADVATIEEPDSEDMNIDQIFETLSLVADVMQHFILDWNWTEEDGTPLPRPCDDKDAFQELATDELVWLMAQVKTVTQALQKKTSGNRSSGNLQ